MKTWHEPTGGGHTPTWSISDTMSFSLGLLSQSGFVESLQILSFLLLLLLLCLLLMIFPANKALAPYHFSAAGREINEGGYCDSSIFSLIDNFHFVGHGGPDKLIAAGSHLLLYCDYQQTVYFQVSGPWTHWEDRVHFPVCEETETDQTRWAETKAEVFFLTCEIIAFRLMWREFPTKPETVLTS